MKNYRLNYLGLILFNIFILKVSLLYPHYRQFGVFKTEIKEMMRADSLTKQYSQLVIKYLYINNDSSSKYEKLAIKESINAKDLSIIGIANLNSAMYFKRNLEAEKALIKLKIAEENFKKANNFKCLGITYNTFGVIYGLISNSNKSTEYYLKSIRYYELDHNCIGVNIPKANLILNYINLNEYNIARKMCFKLLEDSCLKQDSISFAIVMRNLAITYSKDDPKKAIYYLIKILQRSNFNSIEKKQKHQSFISQVYRVLGQSYINQYAKTKQENDFILAKQQILKTKEFCEQNKIVVALNSCYDQLSELYFEKDSYDSCIYMAHLSREVAVKNSIKLNKEDWREYLNKAFAKKGMFDSAYFYLEKLASIKDSMRTDEIKKKMLNAEMEYELEKAEIMGNSKLLKRDKDISDRNFFIAVILGIASLFIFCIVYINKNRQKNRQKQFAILLLKSEEEVRLKMSRELHDNVGQSLLVLKMQSEEKQWFLIDSVIEEVRGLSRELHPIKFENSSLQKLITNLLETIKKSSNIFFSYEVEDVVITDISVKINIYRLVQESISNIIKHSEAQNARVVLFKDKAKLKITILDDGKGFEVSKTKSNTSLGLVTMKERANLINADFKISSSNAGTKIELIV